MVVFGVSMAASIRISNALGAGCPHSARRATFAALGMTMTALSALVAALLAARAAWVRLLTDVQPVIDATLGLMPLFVSSMLLDGAVFSLSSLLRGSGRQKVGRLGVGWVWVGGRLMGLVAEWGRAVGGRCASATQQVNGLMPQFSCHDN